MNKKGFIIIGLLFVMLCASPFCVSVNAQMATFDAKNATINKANLKTNMQATVLAGQQARRSLLDKILNAITEQTITLAKIAALVVQQKLVTAVIGEGNSGTIIRDFNDYLFLSPQQKAMTQMNTFFNTVSRGRLSSLNYEGVGPNYDAYLVAQARQAIGGQNFVTNIQSQVTDPRRMFADGNMKGIMSFVQCANNPACFTMVASQKYNAEFARAQEIAKTQNVNGFMPKITNGRITQPAAIAQNALLQIDQLGTQIIMNAGAGQTTEAALYQIGEGVAISTAARLTNYGISDEAGKESLRNKNDQFPFSLAYSNNGLGFSAGGVTVNTGLASYNGSVQIGNTTACLQAAANGNGDTFVMINGTKTACPKTAGSSLKAPSIGCMDGIAGNAVCQTQCDGSPTCKGAKSICSNNACVIR
ncbi:MAG: hypothetical protein WCJ51_02705 [Candidatus Moraniibacteriota bacterium]